MSNLEINCNQKTASYQEGWNHPESKAEATDTNGNLYNCCECDCDDAYCDDPDCCGCPTNMGCNQQLSICIYEKNTTCHENHEPNEANCTGAWNCTCTTSIRVEKRFVTTEEEEN